MIAAERLDYIIEKLRSEHIVSIQVLSAKLGVTPMTIRRDILQLEEMGLCQRTHGGAISTSRPILSDTPYDQRELLYVNEKQAIARKAAEMVNEGDTIAIDSGTTTFHFAQALKDKKNITVITNSVYVLTELYDSWQINVISCAGILSRSNLTDKEHGDPCLVGPLAEMIMHRFRPQKAFIGTTSLSLVDGLSNSVVDQASMKQAMIEVSSEVILLADHSKFGHVSSAIVGPVTLVDYLITDSGISDEFEKRITELGVKVIKVNP